MGEPQNLSSLETMYSLAKKKWLLNHLFFLLLLLFAEDLLVFPDFPQLKIFSHDKGGQHLPPEMCWLYLRTLLANALFLDL